MTAGNSNTSFYNQNAVTYTDNNPAGPADTPVSNENTNAPSSFFKANQNPGTPITIVEGTGGLPAYTAVAHYFLTGISQSGQWQAAQPSFADISGMISPSQIPPAALTSLGGVDAANPITHEWVQYINSSGQQIFAQPGFSDLSGMATPAQLPAPTSTSIGGVKANTAVPHQWIASINTDGSVTLSQPSFADISGTVASSQLPVATNTTIGGVKTIGQVAHKWVQYIDATGTPVLVQPSFSDLSGQIAPSQNPPIVSNYTAAVTVTATQSPSGSTIQLGGSALFEVTFGAGSTFGTGYEVTLVNVDAYTGIGTGRGKLIHSSAGEFTDFILYPSCLATITYNPTSGTLTVTQQQRFKASGTVITILIDPTNGSDSANDGLAGGSGASYAGTVYAGTSGAFQTFQGAFNNLGRYFDCGIDGVIFLFATATYSISTGVLVYRLAAQSPLIYMRGTNVVFQAATNNISILTITDGAQLVWQGSFTFNCASLITGCNGIFFSNNAICDLTNGGMGALTFGSMPSGTHMSLATGARVGGGAYSISGGAAVHLSTEDGASFTGGGYTVTLTGTPVFSSAFIQTGPGGIIDTQGSPITYSGSATGQSFAWSRDSTVNVNGTTFPGSVAGIDNRPGAWAATSVTLGNPASTTSASGVMCGFAVSFTPKQSGRVFVAAQALGSNNTAGSGGEAAIRYGTGTAPVNGAVLTGTAVGPANGGDSGAANAFFSIALTGFIANLTAGTTYWFDLSQQTLSGGTLQLTNPGLTVIEL